MTAVETIRQAGLRNTAARRQLLELFEKRRAWTAAQLRQASRKADLSTVYRNLRELTQAGLVEAVLNHAGESYYELVGKAHHAHRLCDRCGTASCVPCPLRLKEPHHLELTGRCSQCRAHEVTGKK